MSRSRRSVTRRAADMITTCMIVATVVMVVIAGGWRAAQLLGSGNLRAAGSQSEQTVVVSNGDTLWKLAVKYGPKGKDPREVIAQIRQINNLRNANLKPGTVLKVPMSS